ncbi:MAG: amidohydrolase family protein [Elusimicrobiota bacterium]
MIDAHAHLLTHSILKKTGDQIAFDREKYPEFEKLSSFDRKDICSAWRKALNENGIEKVVFMGMSPGNPEFNLIINSSEKMEGFTSFDPTREGDLKLAKKDIEEAGMKGFKLYPSMLAFSVADKKAYPLYEYCSKNSLPVIIHFGVTIGPRADLRYGNPLDLSPVLSDFPKVPFVIAHFGAGFFREALMLAYKRDNLFFDTSGTNNWLLYHPGKLSLVDIFKQSIDVLGPEKIIFGTDSRLLIDKYRSGILNKQRNILSSLLKPEDVDLVMGGNAKQVYKI